MIHYACPSCGQSGECGDFMARLAIYCKKCHHSIQLSAFPTVVSVVPLSVSAEVPSLAIDSPAPPAVRFAGGALGEEAPACYTELIHAQPDHVEALLGRARALARLEGLVSRTHVPDAAKLHKRAVEDLDLVCQLRPGTRAAEEAVKAKQAINR